MRLASLAAMAAALSGCSGLDAINAGLFGARAPDEADIRYGSGARGTLDVYRPAGGRSAPLIVFLYGGGWDSGEKSMYRFVGSALAAAGFVAVVPDYRIYPEAKYPDFIADAASAVAFAHREAAALGGDPDRVTLLGHSAGAYIAAMLALDRRWLAADGLEPVDSLRAVVGIAGPYDFLPLDTDELRAIFGPPDQLPATQPINAVTGRSPPMLLLAGADDTRVDPGNSRRLAGAIERAGGHAKLIVYPHLSHRMSIGAFAPPLRPFFAPVFADTIAFLREHTAASYASASTNSVRR